MSGLEKNNSEAVMNHIKALAYNRSASSIGESKAISYIENEIEESGITSNRHYFKWMNRVSLLIRGGYLLILLNLIIFRQFLIVVIFFFSKQLFKKTREMSLLPKESSKNLYSYISNNNDNLKRPVIIFSAHYDSESTIIPYRLQRIIFNFYWIVIFFYVGLIFFLTFSFIMGLLNPIANFEFFLTIDITVSLFGIFVSVPLLLLVLIERETSGSIDNASGVAILIELAKYAKQNPLNNVDLLFIWTGAEEGGLKGSKKFCKKYFEVLNEKYDLNNSYNINIDMVGSYIGLLNKNGLIRRKANSKINKIIQSAAKKLQIPVESFSKILGIKSDHKSFKKKIRRRKRGFQIACIHSDKDSKYIHSKKDTPDKCSKEVLNNCLYLLEEVIESIDDDFEID
ncbi:MAG: M28 family peptidase [Candidatus Lokiarchaeota archaeon]|nr:M28 family peptidase [Candidatus Lokiarchaeota archaeon]MBD3202369.1 M28 family peptidase [Candidatus Lokiarchaeota archaeon]